MNRRRTRWLAATTALSAGVLAVVAVPPSSAETKVRTDKQGDAPARIDVFSARYMHKAHRVAGVAHIPELGDAGEAALSISKFDIFEAGYVVRIRKRVGEDPRVKLLYYNHFDLLPRACDGVAGRWGEDRIRLSVPRSCLEGHKAPDLFVQFGIARGDDVDHAPAVKNLARG